MIALVIFVWWYAAWQQAEAVDCARFPLDDRCMSRTFVPSVPVDPARTVPFRRFGVQEVPRYVDR